MIICEGSVEQKCSKLRIIFYKIQKNSKWQTSNNLSLPERFGEV
jgi:hypothetical protein